MPPAKRELNTSMEAHAINDYVNTLGGYSSPGQEPDSAHITQLKRKKTKAITNRESQASTALSKITKPLASKDIALALGPPCVIQPSQPLSLTSSQVGIPKQSHLPDIKGQSQTLVRQNSKSSMRT